VVRTGTPRRSSTAIVAVVSGRIAAGGDGGGLAVHYCNMSNNGAGTQSLALSFVDGATVLVRERCYGFVLPSAALNCLMKVC
jgi:hypothetical protein